MERLRTQCKAISLSSHRLIRVYKVEPISRFDISATHYLLIQLYSESSQTGQQRKHGGYRNMQGILQLSESCCSGKAQDGYCVSWHAEGISVVGVPSRRASLWANGYSERVIARIRASA